ALVGKPEQISRRQAVVLLRVETGQLEGEFRQDVVEIVTSEPADPFGSHDGVTLTVRLHQRRIEGTTAEIINQDSASSVLAVTARGMTELDARRGGLVQYTQYVEICTSKSLDRQEPLARVRVGRHPKHDFKRLSRTHI